MQTAISLADEHQHEYDHERAAKRRKIRKGTHSCWACKRRKEKCIHGDGSAICLSCQHRGTPCVSQQFPEDHVDTATLSQAASTSHHDYQLHQRLARIESLLVCVLEREDDNHTTTFKSSPSLLQGVTDDASSYNANSRDGSATTRSGLSVNQDVMSNNKTLSYGVPDGTHLSGLLHQALPSASVYELLNHQFERNACGLYAIAQLTTPYASLEDPSYSPIRHLPVRRPRIDARPVLIARHMLILANFLLQLPSELRMRTSAITSPESPRAIAEQLMAVVSRSVLSRDELHDNLESLQCMMLATMYYSIHGDLRRSWVTSRKALLLAQLFGLDQPTRVHKKIPVLDGNHRLDTEVMWTQIVFYDRHLCLLLGLSQGSTDRSMASGPAFQQDTPTGRLQRIHSDVASQIIERNSSSQATSDCSTTQSLDAQLLQAARSMPSSWWRIPSFTARPSSDTQTPYGPSFPSLRALGAQMFHYSLLNQVHLPYMLRTDNHFAHSRGVCMNAAREMLSRYSLLRKSCQVGSSCRVIDFLALMAAMTLLLSHLRSTATSTGSGPDVLAHQYPSDRSLIEEAHELAEAAAKSDDSDWISLKSAHVLRRLLDVDNEIAKGSVTHAQRVTVHVDGDHDGDNHNHGDSAIRVHIPYFGVINIARDLVTAIPTIPLSFNFPQTSTDVQHHQQFEASSSDWQSQFTPSDLPLNEGFNDGTLDPTHLSSLDDQWVFEGMNVAFFGNLLNGN